MTMPNFLILGAAKTGTTSLYRYLKQHPDIYMSPSKEPRFFVFEGETLDYQGPGDREETAQTDLSSYAALFNGVDGEKAIGEASTMYLWSPKAPQRIHHHIPDAKLIAILRDPVDRAYSNFLHMVQARREPLSDFAEAIEREEERIRSHWWPFWYYKQQGFYYEQLKRYLSLFAQAQMAIYLYEDLQNSPLEMMGDIFSFLEVDDRFTPDISERVRKARPIPKNKILHSLLTQPNPLKSALKSVFPSKLRQQVASSVKEKNLVKLKPSEEVRQQLIEEYREDILNLQDLIGRDLSKWLSC